MCGRLFVIAISFWIMNIEYQCIHFMMADTNPDRLMLSGDVESHPGPVTIEQQILHLQQTMQSAFDSLSSKIDQNNLVTHAKLDETTRQVNEIKTTVTDMKKSMTDMQTRVSDIEEQQHIQQLDGVENSERICTLSDRLDKVEDNIEQKAREERKPNVILHAVTEQPGDDDSNTSVIARTVILLNQHVPVKVWSNCDIRSAFRMGTKDNNVGKNRPILVSFNKFTDKLLTLKARDHLKTLHIGISNDLTPYQRDELSKLKEQNKFGYYKQGKLVVVDSDTRGRQNNNNNNNMNPATVNNMA